jgi:hypothetical protein
LAIGAVLLWKAQVYRNPLDSRLIIGKIYGLTLKKAEGRSRKAKGSQLERYSNTKSALIAPFPNPVFFSPAPLS